MFRILSCHFLVVVKHLTRASNSSVARFIKLAFQGTLLWTLLFQAAVRRYDTACLLSVLPSFSRLPSHGCSTSSTPGSRRIAPSYGFLPIAVSVPYLLSGARHFQRCFESHVYLLVDRFWACFVWLNGLATFAGIVPVIS